MKWKKSLDSFFFLLSTLLKYSARNPQQDPRELQDTFGWKKGCRSQDGKRKVWASLDPGRFPFEKIRSKRKEAVVKKTSERSKETILAPAFLKSWPTELRSATMMWKLSHFIVFIFFLNSPLFLFLLCLLTASEQPRGSRPTHLLCRDPTPRLEPWLPPPGGEAKNTFFKKRFNLLGWNQIIFIYPPSGPVTWSPILCCCCCCSVYLSLPMMTSHNNQRHQLLIPKGS